MFICIKCIVNKKRVVSKLKREKQGPIIMRAYIQKATLILRIMQKYLHLCFLVLF